MINKSQDDPVLQIKSDELNIFGKNISCLVMFYLSEKQIVIFEMKIKSELEI
jgi:hypothetical protein